MQDVARQAGGFCWWYVDLVDARGNGVVLIPSFGLPFLPGTRGASGMRDVGAGAERPSLNVAVYRGYRPQFYLLQELEPDEVTFATRADGAVVWQLGASSITVHDDGAQVRCAAQLDCPVPAQHARLTGTVSVTGARLVPSSSANKDHPTTAALAEPADAAHLWAPRTTATTGRASLRWGDDEEDGAMITGRAYFDANASPTPLHRQGIRAWQWGRVGIGERELIYYVVSPEEGGRGARHVMVVEPDGVATIHRTPTLGWEPAGRGTYGLERHRQLTVSSGGLHVRIQFESVVDDGPFYLRSLIRATDLQTQEVGTGVAEQVVPGRVDLPWQRPFIRMRRHVVGGTNSMWLPLFNGKRAGRFSRLVSPRWLSDVWRARA